MENIIKRIIWKVRKMYGNDIKYKDILKQNATVTLKEDASGQLQVTNVRFAYFDIIEVHRSGIVFCPEQGKPVILLKFDSLEKFLEI